MGWEELGAEGRERRKSFLSDPTAGQQAVHRRSLTSSGFFSSCPPGGSFLTSFELGGRGSERRKGKPGWGSDTSLINRFTASVRCWTLGCN